MVGHQPTIFHPGILAKFMVADRLAKEIDGELVFLVVDHHQGNVGVLHSPEGEVQIANIDATQAMNTQSRAEIIHEFEPITTALQEADGENAAVQFANALVQMMSPWVQVRHTITATELMQSSFGNAIVEHVYLTEQACVQAYNTAVNQFSESHVPELHEDTVPFRKSAEGELQPRALLLTLLARLVACDLFVHGKGGSTYDRAMEQWCKNWLDVTPCNAVMATATLQLQLDAKSLTDARREFYSPPSKQETKSKYLRAIEDSPYQSPQKKAEFQNMHRWLHEIQSPLDVKTLKRDEANTKKRDWAFPLYSVDQLDHLQDCIYSM